MKISSTLLVRFIENALDKTLNAFLYGLGTSIEFVLLKDNKHQLSCNTTPDLHFNPRARSTRRTQIKDSNSYAPPEYAESKPNPRSQTLFKSSNN